jgi:hypothetical protein
MGNHISNETLLCPKCGGSNTHQQEVTIEFRDREDGDGNQTVCNKRLGLSVVGRISGNEIAGRRDNIYIKFICEEGHKFTVHIQQHKGNTLLKIMDIVDCKREWH